ncbi:unnamed protein product [Diamesa hyperborea]
MGAEVKFDLRLAFCDNMSNFDISSSNNAGGITCDITASKKMSSKSNILGNNRKSSSTPSIPEATGGNHNHRNPISSNYQAASAENLIEEISVNVLSNARSDLAGIGSEFEHIDNVPAEVPAVPNILHLATITENLTIDKDKSPNNYISCSTRSPGCGTTSLGSFSQQESIISTRDKASNLNEANNKINLCNSSSSITETLLNTKMEMFDLLRNNTNSLLTTGILSQTNLLSSVKMTLPKNQEQAGDKKCGTSNQSKNSLISNKKDVTEVQQHDVLGSDLMIATSSVAMSEISSLPTNCSVMTRRRDSSNNNLNLNEIAGGSLNNSCGTEQGSFLPRGSNSVTSLEKLASSSYFHPGLLSTAQTYSCLTTSKHLQQAIL